MLKGEGGTQGNKEVLIQVFFVGPSPKHPMTSQDGMTLMTCPSIACLMSVYIRCDVGDAAPNWFEKDLFITSTTVR